MSVHVVTGLEALLKTDPYRAATEQFKRRVPMLVKSWSSLG
jgi:hypothetical protein